MSMSNPLNHLGSIWYHSEPSESPISQTSFLTRTFLSLFTANGSSDLFQIENLFWTCTKKIQLVWNNLNLSKTFCAVQNNFGLVEGQGIIEQQLIDLNLHNSLTIFLLILKPGIWLLLWWYWIWSRDSRGNS